VCPVAAGHANCGPQKPADPETGVRANADTVMRASVMWLTSHRPSPAWPTTGDVGRADDLAQRHHRHFPWAYFRHMAFRSGRRHLMLLFQGVVVAENRTAHQLIGQQVADFGGVVRISGVIWPPSVLMSRRCSRLERDGSRGDELELDRGAQMRLAHAWQVAGNGRSRYEGSGRCLAIRPSITKGARRGIWISPADDFGTGMVSPPSALKPVRRDPCARMRLARGSRVRRGFNRWRFSSG